MAVYMTQQSHDSSHEYIMSKQTWLLLLHNQHTNTFSVIPNSCISTCTFCFLVIRDTCNNMATTWPLFCWFFTRPTTWQQLFLLYQISTCTCISFLVPDGIRNCMTTPWLLSNLFFNTWPSTQPALRSNEMWTAAERGALSKKKRAGERRKIAGSGLEEQKEAKRHKGTAVWTREIKEHEQGRVGIKTNDRSRGAKNKRIAGATQESRC